MKRRTLLQVVAAGLVGSSALPARAGRAQDDATPDPVDGIPPIRWNLVSIDVGDDTLTWDDPSRYWVQFVDGGLVYIKADCNSASGHYRLEDDSIEITDVISTLVMCSEESLDQDLLGALSAATSYSISQDASDQLVLSIGDDGASAVFSATLTGVIWEWEQFAAGNDTTTVPDAPERFTLEFLEDGSLAVEADCNSGGGSYTVDGNQVDLTVTSTEIACGEGSSSDEYVRILADATSFVIRDGNLHLALPMDAGIALFRAVVPESLDQLATPEA